MLPPNLNKLGRPNIVRGDLLQKIKEVVIGVRFSGTVISRKMVVSMGNWVLKANDPNTLSEFPGHINLTNDWSRATLQSTDWVKCKGTNGKIEPSSQLQTEERFIFQKSIATAVYDHDTSSNFINNLDQTLLTCFLGNTHLS